MADSEHIPSTDAASDATWAAAARRLRRLHRVQLAVLVAFSLLMVAVVGGSVALNQVQEERHGRLDDAIYEVSDAFDELRAVHTRIIERGGVITASDGITVLRSRGRLVAVQSTQGTTFTGNPEMAAGARDSIAALDAIVALGQSPVNLLSQPDLSDPLKRLDAAGARWFAAMQVARDTDDAEGDAIRRRLLLITVAMVLLLSIAALLLWRGLGRARGRLVDELHRTGREHDAMTRIALAAAGSADMRELRAIAEEAIALPLEGARVRVVDGPEAAAERELAASGTARPGLLRREVTAGDAPWGVVVAEWEGDVPPPDAAARMERLSETLGLAAERIAAREALEAQAVTDSLTGLANHRAFHEALADRLTHAEAHLEPLAVAVIDVDALGDVNAAFGHATGDEVIAEVSRRVAALAEPGEIVARISGQALGWILPGHTAATAAQRALTVRRAIAGVPIPPAGGVSVSVGIADLEDATVPGRLVAAADAALRAAKASGRDATRTHAAARAAGETREQDTASQRREFAALRALARAVDLRDENTQRHSERVAALSHRLALELGWEPARAARLRQAALVHDVGKVGVPDSVLLKPGRLTAEERAVIETHVTLGAQIVSEVLDHEQVRWVRGHHERIDGGGYPDRLPGHEIPDGARVMAVADTWDAMTADPPYREGMPPKQALAICREVAGSQLCQHCVNGLVVLYERGALDGADPV